jgi:K+ transporter
MSVLWIWLLVVSVIILWQAMRSSSQGGTGVFVVRDATETRCRTVCGKPFTALERSWLVSPAAGGTAVFQRDAILTNVAGELYGPSVAVLSRAGGSKHGNDLLNTCAERSRPDAAARTPGRAYDIMCADREELSTGEVARTVAP